VFREKVVETGLLTDEQLDDIFEEARERVQDAASASQVAPRATEADLMTDVYGSY
jgi:TPP-dependent pyruvate/acetoin dehydrogenase alpha subunit